jgi:hypothetical protein
MDESGLNSPTSEDVFVAEYMELTGASERRARSVYMYRGGTAKENA